MSVKILHAADFHMDSPFDGLSDEKAKERRKEQRELLFQMAELCKKENVQLVLLAGDLLDSAASYHETHEALCSAFSQMPCEIFISPGNHDYYCPQSPYVNLEFPKNVHIFLSASIKSYEIKELGCRIWGAGFSSRSCPSIFHGFTAPKDDLINLMVIHGDTSDKTYNLITEEDIALSGLDYLALGHIHKYSGIKKAGDTTYAYAGCPEGRGFDELGEKGVIVGEIDKGRCNMRFVPMGGREYQIVKLDVTGKPDIEQAIREAIPETAGRDVFRIVLKGETDVEINLQKLNEEFSDQFYEVSFRNETVPTRDIWSEMTEDTLKGAFLRKMRDRLAGGSDEDKAKAAMAVLFGLSAIENREEWQR